MPGDDSGLCTCALCRLVTHLWLEHEQGRAGVSPGLTSSYLSLTAHCCSLSGRKFHFVTTSSHQHLMTHNFMLNVIQSQRRRQEFSADQTCTIHWPSKYLLGVELES